MHGDSETELLIQVENGRQRWQRAVTLYQQAEATGADPAEMERLEGERADAAMEYTKALYALAEFIRRRKMQ